MLTHIGPFPTIPAAERVVKARGFSDRYDEGESGDNGPASRLYYRRPSAPTNRYGAPLEHATISLVGGGWFVALFEGEAK